MTREKALRILTNHVQHECGGKYLIASDKAIEALEQVGVIAEIRAGIVNYINEEKQKSGGQYSELDLALKIKAKIENYIDEENLKFGKQYSGLNLALKIINEFIEGVDTARTIPKRYEELIDRDALYDLVRSFRSRDNGCGYIDGIDRALKIIDKYRGEDKE